MRSGEKLCRYKGIFCETGIVPAVNQVVFKERQRSGSVGNVFYEKQQCYLFI